LCRMALHRVLARIRDDLVTRIQQHRQERLGDPDRVGVSPLRADGISGKPSSTNERPPGFPPSARTASRMVTSPMLWSVLTATLRPARSAALSIPGSADVTTALMSVSPSDSANVQWAMTRTSSPLIARGEQRDGVAGGELHLARRPLRAAGQPCPARSRSRPRGRVRRRSPDRFRRASPPSARWGASHADVRTPFASTLASLPAPSPHPTSARPVAAISAPQRPRMTPPEVRLNCPTLPPHVSLTRMRR
jgi:hypothetical protein